MVDQPADSGDADFAAHDRTMGLQHTQRGDVAILSVSGDVDALTAPQLTEAVRGILGSRPTAVIVDLSDVVFLASAGMSALVDIQELLSPDAKLIVVADGSATSRPIKLVGIDKVVELHPTLDEALKANRQA
jgi:anti-sigma B factor antagonist